MTIAANLSIPGAAEVNQREVDSWYQNVAHEIDDDRTPEAHRLYLRDYYREAGLLQRYRRAYFMRHFARSFARAAGFLLPVDGPGPIIDLGCGSGTQVLYLALKGARVVAVDADERALAALSWRLQRYQELSGRQLDVKVINADVFVHEFAQHAPIRGLYSMFAFNIMQPSEQLLDRIVPNMPCGSRIAIIDGNNTSWLQTVYPPSRRQALSPRQLRLALEKRGFTTAEHVGTVAVPPLAWYLAPALARVVDAGLCRHMFTSRSHQILAELEQTTLTAARA